MKTGAEISWATRAVKALVRVSLPQNAPSVTGLLFLSIWLASCHASKNESVKVTWPLGRAGTKVVVLNLPDSYGAPNRSAEALNALVYKDKQPASGSGAYKELLLEALWPGLDAPNRENREEFEQPGGGRRMLTLIRSGAIDDFADRHFDALQIQFKLSIDESARQICVSHTKDGRFAPAHCYVRDTPDIKTPEFGLQRFGMDFSRYPDFPEVDRAGLYANDIYYWRDERGNLRTIILCTAEEAKTVDDGPKYHTVPQCEHYFVSEKLNALCSVLYRRVYLKDWRAVEAQWRSLLESLVITQNTSGNSNN